MELSLQQIPYPFAGPACAFWDDNDVLEPVIGRYALIVLGRAELTRTVPRYCQPQHTKDRWQPDQTAKIIAVPDLNDVQPFMSEPEFLGEESVAPEAQLTADKPLAESYRNVPSESVYACNLKEQVKRTLAHAWKFDPLKCSIKAAREAACNEPHDSQYGFTEQEFKWVKGLKLSRVQAQRTEAQAELDQAMQYLTWQTSSLEDEKLVMVNGVTLSQELDEFYGPSPSVSRHIDDNEVDEGFCESSITTTWVSLPEKPLLPIEQASGIVDSQAFKDSGIYMDDGYAEATLPDSPPNTAVKASLSTLPTFYAKVAPLWKRKQSAPRLALFGDNNEVGWESRREAPYDLAGFNTLESGLSPSPDSSEAVAEINAIGEAAPLQSIRPLGAVDHYVEDLSSLDTPVPTFQDSDREMDLPVDDIDQLFEDIKSKDAPSRSFRGSDHTMESPVEDSICQVGDFPLTANVARNSEVPAGKMESSVPETRSRALATAQVPSSVELQENSKGISIPQLEEEHSNPSGIIAQSTDDVRTKANGNQARTLSTVPPTTPVHLRSGDKRVNTLATPSPINLTPEYDSDGDSDTSIKFCTPSSPTNAIRGGQSAFNRHIETTVPHLNFVRQRNSKVDLDGFSLPSYTDSIMIPMTQHQGRVRLIDKTVRSSKADIAARGEGAEALLQTPKQPNENGNYSKNLPALTPYLPVVVTPTAKFAATPPRPPTPFQFNTPSRCFPSSPASPTPAPRGGDQHRGKSNFGIFSQDPNKSRQKSVKNVFRSSNLASYDSDDGRIGQSDATAEAGKEAVEPGLGQNNGIEGQVAQAVVVHPKDQNEEKQETHAEEPPKKKLRRSTRVADMGGTFLF